MSQPEKSDHLLLRAIRGERVERTPVWAMRQAGRWDQEFLKLRGNLTFYEFSENPELAARASLLPVRFGVDAVILFYDITTLPLAMGVPFDLQPKRGPVPHKPIRTAEQLDQLQTTPDPVRYQYILDLLRIVQQELAGKLPVLVFAGAPFTVASYCIDTGKDIDATRRFAAEHPLLFLALLDKLELATISFLKTLAALGASAYQLFDSWAGELTRDEYRLWAQPYHHRILSAVRDIPSILFVKECPYLDLLVESGADTISLGQCHRLATARQDYPQKCFQGNVSQGLLKSGTAEQVVAATRVCLAEGGRQNHILTLNHGVDPATPMANFEAFVRTAIAAHPRTT